MACLRTVAKSMKNFRKKKSKLKNEHKSAYKYLQKQAKQKQNISKPLHKSVHKIACKTKKLAHCKKLALTEAVNTLCSPLG